MEYLLNRVFIHSSHVARRFNARKFPPRYNTTHDKTSSSTANVEKKCTYVCSCKQIRETQMQNLTSLMSRCHLHRLNQLRGCRSRATDTKTIMRCQPSHALKSIHIGPRKQVLFLLQHYSTLPNPVVSGEIVAAPRPTHPLDCMPRQSKRPHMAMTRERTSHPH